MAYEYTVLSRQHEGRKQYLVVDSNGDSLVDTGTDLELANAACQVANLAYMSGYQAGLDESAPGEETPTEAGE